MSDHQVILQDLRKRANQLQMKADSYGEDLGAPYRDAAESLREIADTYGETVPTDYDN